MLGLGKPRLLSQTLCLKRLDLFGMSQRQADVVKAVEQAILAKGLHVKWHFFALGLDNHLALKIDGELIPREGQRFTEQLVYLRSLSTMGRMPFLKLLLKKMSA
jgi:hypothetical protein